MCMMSEFNGYADSFRARKALACSRWLLFVKLSRMLNPRKKIIAYTQPSDRIHVLELGIADGTALKDEAPLPGSWF